MTWPNHTEGAVCAMLCTLVEARFLELGIPRAEARAWLLSAMEMSKSAVYQPGRAGPEPQIHPDIEEAVGALFARIRNAGRPE